VSEPVGATPGVVRVTYGNGSTHILNYLHIGDVATA
jgi:hypothetical protein